MPGYRYPFIVFLLGTILLDSLSKNWFWLSRPDLFPGHYAKLIYFEAHQNFGLMLGLGSQLSDSMRLFIGVILVSLFLSILFSILIYRGFSSHSTSLAWGLMLGGGISNVMERIRSDAVSDFIIIDFGSFQSGIFNLADLANLIGLFILISAIILKGKVR